MAQLNLSTSLDGKVIEITKESEDSLNVWIKVPFVHQEHLDYFINALSNGTVFADLRARTSILGFDLRIIGEGNNAFVRDNMTIIYEATLFPYRDTFFPHDGHWKDIVGYIDWDAGKLVAVLHEQIVQRPEVESLIQQGKVKLREGSMLTEVGSFIKIDGNRYKPIPQKMNVACLRQAHDNLDREELAQFMEAEYDHSGMVSVPANSGKLAHTSVRTGIFSLLLDHDQKEGVRTTQALHVSPHSSEDLFIGLKGNKTGSVSLDGVTAKFLKNPLLELKGTITVPGLKLEQTRDLAHEPYSPRYSAFIFRPNASTQKISKIADIDPEDSNDLKKFSGYLATLEGKSNILYFNTFPSGRIVNEFLAARIAEKLYGVIFCRAPVLGTSFSDTDFSDILRMRKCGIEVIWDHPTLDRLYFHRIGFMGDKERVFLENAYSSNSIVAAFGSASYCSQEDSTNINQAISGVAKFIGDTGYIINGGGPAIMQDISLAAKQHGLHVATASLAIAQEAPQQLYRHSIMPFGGRHINLRQGVMTDNTTGTLVFSGGVGTDSETFEVLTKVIVESKAGWAYIIGDAPEQRALVSLIETNIAQKRAPELLRRHYKHLVSGAMVYDALMDHYKFTKV
jgi:predicted Rossmann-fold nucleotide-binding protein